MGNTRHWVLKAVTVLTCLLVLVGVGYAEAEPDTLGMPTEWRDSGWAELLMVLDSLNEAKDVDLAIAVGRLALEKVEAEIDPSDTAVARVLDALGKCYVTQMDNENADSVLTRALRIRERVLGTHHNDVAGTMNRLAKVRVAMEHYAEAESLLVHALKTRESLHGPTHADVGEILLSLAHLHYREGKYDRSETEARRVLSIYEEAYGPTHLEVANVLNMLAASITMRSRYTEAGQLYERALAISKERLGPEHQDVGMLLANLALIAQRQREYSEAQLLYEEAIPVLEKTVGLRHGYTQQAMNNLAGLYMAQSRYAEARPLFEEVLTIWQQTYGPEHSIVASPMHNLAIIAKRTGDYTEAEELYKQAIAIRERTIGPDHPRLAESLNGLFYLYMRQQRYAEADSLVDRVFDIFRKVYGPGHPASATSMHARARLDMTRGEYEEADSLLRHAIGIWEAIYGSDHSSVAVGLETYSDLLRLKESKIEALKAAERAFMIRRGDFLDNSLLLAESKALDFARSLRNSADNYLTCFLDADPGDSSSMDAAACIVLSAKGQVTQVILDRQQALAVETDSSTRALTEALRHVRYELSKRFTRQQTEDRELDVTELASIIDSLTERAEYLDDELSSHSMLLVRQREQNDITIDRVKTMLPSDAVLLEYKTYRYTPAEHDATSSPRYLATVIDHGGCPYIYDLGEANRIDSAITQYRQHMLRVSLQPHMPLPADKEEYEAVARELYDMVVRPIERHLHGNKLVLVSPDGGLNLISFAGLIDKTGAYLIERFALHYLSAGREILRVVEDTACGQGLLAIGDPDYDAIPVSELGQLRVDQHTSTERLNNALVIARAGREYFEGHSLTDLPGTRAEIGAIGESWRNSTDETAAMYFGGEATEGKFKAEAPGKRVIHLATHGYCISDESEQSASIDRNEIYSTYVGTNPLLQSGLFFAGANYRGEGTEGFGVEDGILTAYEVSAMDLRGTEMVVLSACETGLGEVRQGEGVYGLRRAFHMAGVKTIISALWSVPDKETAAIMGEIYTESSETVPEKLRRVQLDRIARLRTENRSDHPYRWAAFVAVGDWR